MKISVKQVSDWEELSSSFIRQWEKLLCESSRLDLLYQTPLWFEHLLTQSSIDNTAKFYLCQLTNSSGNLSGLVPLSVHTYFLKFDIAAYSFIKMPIRVACVLGSQFLVPEEKHLYVEIIQQILDSLPECDAIYFDCIPSDSFAWDVLFNVTWDKFNALLYSPEGPVPYHYLVLPKTFNEYLTRFKRKKKYNLKRQVRELKAIGGEAFQWERITQKDQVENFLRKAETISLNSWQQRRLGTRVKADEKYIKKFSELSKKGILRCYLLNVDKPCAFIVGLQHADVYHYVEIGYDKYFSKYSPGIVALYLLIEDLISERKISKINFGIGHAAYKKQFGTHHLESASIFLLRTTLRNRILVACHAIFRTGVKRLRSFAIGVGPKLCSGR